MVMFDKLRPFIVSKSRRTAITYIQSWFSQFFVGNYPLSKTKKRHKGAQQHHHLGSGEARGCQLTGLRFSSNESPCTALRSPLIKTGSAWDLRYVNQVQGDLLGGVPLQVCCRELNPDPKVRFIAPRLRAISPKRNVSWMVYLNTNTNQGSTTCLCRKLAPC